jgi:hypothetical protein
MEHRGVEYRIIQGIKPGVRKWSVETETGTKSGTSDRKDAAVIAVKLASDTRPIMNIEQVLSPGRLGRRRRSRPAICLAIAGQQAQPLPWAPR